MRAFRVAIGTCRACGRRVQGRHRLQTSDALGAAGVQLGPQVVASAAILNKQLGLSFGKVATLLRQQYGLTVSRSGLVHAVDRAGRRAQPTYAALREQIRRSPVVTPDETGWKVGGRLQWLWAAATPATTVYAIEPGRGYPQAAALLGNDFAGVLVRDGWAPYRQFTAATHQSCLAHLLRRCRLLRADHPHSRVVTDIQTDLQRALELRARRRAGTLSAADLDALVERLAWRVTHPGPLADVRRFAAHLTTEWTALFTFLYDPAGHRRHQLARRTRHPARRRHAQGLRRQSVLARRHHPANPRLRDPNRLPAQPQPTRRPRLSPTRPHTNRCA